MEIHPNTTSIGDYALHFCKNLTSIDIPETIENIGNYSFRYSGLKEIELPNSVTHIGRYAFENCDNLERVKLPNRINTIEAGTFAFCQNLKTMLIPGNVTEINLDAFTQCSNACIVIVNPETEISNSDYYFGIAATIYARGNTYSYLYNSYPELNNADRLNYLFDVLAILNGHMTIGPNSSFHNEFTTDFLWEPANGIQFDLTLPAGLKLTNFVIKDLNNSEDASGNPSPKVNFSYTQLENGDYRIIVFTTDGSMMNHGVYWNWEFESDETLTRSNILCHNIMLSIDNQEVAFADENMYVTGYDITMPEIETIEEGDTLTLPQNPLSATYDDITYTWTTPTPQTISIDGQGVMTALKPGPASIEIYINDPRYYFGNGRNFTVTPALYGDSNESGAIDLADVVTTVNYILERNPEPFSFKKADVDKNGRINVVDVTSTVKLVLEQPKEENPDQSGTMRAPLLSEFSFAEPQLKQDGKRHVELILDTPAEYTALQTDIELPAGGHIERIALANGLDRHSLDYAAIDGTTSRVLVYSMALAAFPNERNTAVIDITLSDDGLTEESLIRASGNLACDAAGNSFRSAPAEMLIGTSAVKTVAADTDSRAYATKGGIITYAPSGTSIVICDTNGGIVADTVSNGTATLHALQTGIYIVSFGNGVTAKAAVR